MKIPAVVTWLTLATLSVAGCNSTTTPENPDPEHNARNSLDWAGAYGGVLPCADCDGIDTIVVLTEAGDYHLHEKYLGMDETIFSAEGQFSWNDAGNTVTLTGDEPARFFVGENHLVRLATDGSRVTGALAEFYILNKIDHSPTEKYWKLIELNGQPVPTLAREAHIVFRIEGNRVDGFAGCNGFSGVYQMNEAQARVSFEHIASTLKACPSPEMEVEQALHEVLQNADNYSFDGYYLTLNRARMAPLARFEVMYLY